MDLKEKITKSSLFDGTNRFYQLYCCWIISYLKFIFTKVKNGTQMEIEDLHRCSSEDESEKLYKMFQCNYELSKNHFKSNDSIEFRTKFKARVFGLHQRITRNIMLMTLIQTFRSEALFPFLLFFAQDCVIKPVQPVLIGYIIRYFYKLSDNDPSNSFFNCLLTVICLCASSIMMIATHHPSLTFAMKMSMRIKVIWSSLIYNKCLQLNTNGQNNYNISSIINMMTNDIRRFDEFALMINYLLIVPIQTVMILTIAWYYIGYSCLATFMAFIVLAYAFSYLSKHFAKLRTESIVFTENRLKSLDEVFRHLRAIKIYTLENKFMQKIINLRKVELVHLRIPLICRAIILSFSMVSSRVIMYFSICLYLLDSKENFHPENVFVSVALFERLRYCLTWTLPQAISGLYDMIASCERMDDFLKMPQKSIVEKAVNNSKQKGIFVKNLCSRGLFDSKQSEKHFQLEDISFDICSGQVLTIVGLVGSGKTTLFLTLLSEIKALKSDRFEISGTVSYFSQEVYTLNSTIRDNILFGRDYDTNRYQEVLRVCALKHDLDRLPLGDQTLIGESGFTLSGGQRARIGLARALYRDTDIYLLDDPLSAVDAHLAKHIYEKCINSFLRNKCVLIATHQLQFVSQDTQVLLLEKGRSVAYGKFNVLMKTNKNFNAFFNMTKHQINSDSIDEGQIEEETPNKIVNKKESKIFTTDSKEIKPERIKHNELELNICKDYWDYLKQGSAGFGSVSLVLASAVFTQASLYACDHWLTLWNKTTLSRITFFSMYTLIVISIITFAILRAFTFYKLCLGASERTHNRIAEKIMAAPINFFEYISVGKLLSIFSRDIGVLDETLPSVLFEMNLAFSQVFFTVCIIVFMNPYMTMVTFIYLILLYKVRQYFVSPTHVIRKFEIQTRNQIFAHLNSTMSGLSTIRAFSVQSIYQKRFFNLLNDSTATLFLQIATSRMFCLIIDLISFLYIIVVIGVLFMFTTSTNGQLIGLSLGSIFNLIGVAQWAWKRTIDSDLWIMSYRNLSSFETLPTEGEDEFLYQKEKQIASYQIIESQYSKFYIDFENLSVFYRDNCFDEQQSKLVDTLTKQNHRLVLKNVNLRMNFGEKIGICGRSGTGKSTLINALLRLTRYTGEIRINGNEINKYSLTDLRRNISIIPQYPVIFNGSVRDNLDLFHQHCEKDLWNVLEKVQLRSMVEEFEGQLDEHICTETVQMSMGQKQLICLARIMLQNNQLIILDEATANVDFHTDKLIQKTIRQVFADCTVITIAHRLDSIIDCDRILVFDNGFLVEDDSPRHLLQNQNSHFAQLVKQTGAKMASRLESSVLCSTRSS